jgi:hypothetical protein
VIKYNKFVWQDEVGEEAKNCGWILLGGPLFTVLCTNLENGTPLMKESNYSLVTNFERAGQLAERYRLRSLELLLILALVNLELTILICGPPSCVNSFW